jgi:hypothetical protein
VGQAAIQCFLGEISDSNHQFFKEKSGAVFFFFFFHLKKNLKKKSAVDGRRV